MNGRQGLIILAIVLGLILLGSVIWGWGESREKKKLQIENKVLGNEIKDLTVLRDELSVEVDSLQSAYSILAKENESLQSSLEDAEKEIAKKTVAVRNVQRRNINEINGLRAQIEELLADREGLENSIVLLQAENDSLKIRTGVLEKDLYQAKADYQQLAALNKVIEDELRKLTLANFKASAFQVEIEKKSSRVTAKASKARRAVVTFDLADVPSKYQGIRPLYLSITDRNGNPIQATNPIRVSVDANGQTVELIAVESKNVNITDGQRLTFQHELDSKLRKGYYRVSVYTDIGLLGSSTFRLQ